MVIEINNSNKVDFKVIFLGVILASFIHLIAIPLIELIPQRSLEEEEEPRIILDLTKKVDTLSPIIEQKILKPQINNNTQEQQIVEEIPPLKQMKKVQEFEKQIISPLPKNFNENIENTITIPIKPDSKNTNKKFTTPIIPKNEETIEKKSLKSYILKQNTTAEPRITSSTKKILPEENIPIIENNLPPIPSKKEQLIKNNNGIDPNLERLYISSIRKSIQTYAINNYPYRSLRNNEEGTVDIIFKLKLDGNIENITIGPKTLASKRLIDAAIKAVEQNAPYENEEILKQKNEFSILIIYKID